MKLHPQEKDHIRDCQLRIGDDQSEAAGKDLCSRDETNCT